VEGARPPTRLQVRVVPRARQNSAQREPDGVWRIRLVAPPVDGKANAALVEYLAARLAVPRRAVRVVAGAKSRDKLVAIDGLTLDEVSARLGDS
jgi:uncharacterized protein YggU (UPF0235/DUF167 family)